MFNHLRSTSYVPRLRSISLLVIISDLHLTDGTSSQTIQPGAFRIFKERLSDLAYDASRRTDGSYKPVETIDLILLGDIFDLIRSSKWVVNDDGSPCLIRPWNDINSQPFIDKIREIHTDILTHNAESFSILKAISQQGGVTIPPATSAGDMQSVSRDPADPQRHSVTVRTHYMVGNHDWFYHLIGPAYDQMRQEVIEALGLYHPADKPFPHDLVEVPDLEGTCATHNVYARHGDIYDTDNFDGNRNASSLGDAVVVEILNRFPTEVDLRLGHELPQACLAGLKELDNVRPVLVIPVWINDVLERTCKNRRQIQKVKDIWDELADNFLRVPFVQAHNERWKFPDQVDTLELALKFSKRIPLRLVSQFIAWFQKKSKSRVSYHKTAFAEPAFKHKTAKYIVHGHTHHHEIVPLDSSLVGGKPFNQFYLNSGTWRRVHELAQYKPEQQEFMGYYEMTYFAFYTGTERKGRPFEVWAGTLGVSENDN